MQRTCSAEALCPAARLPVRMASKGPADYDHHAPAHTRSASHLAGTLLHVLLPCSRVPQLPVECKQWRLVAVQCNLHVAATTTCTSCRTRNHLPVQGEDIAADGCPLSPHFKSRQEAEGFSQGEGWPKSSSVDKVQLSLDPNTNSIKRPYQAHRPAKMMSMTLNSVSFQRSTFAGTRVQSGKAHSCRTIGARAGRSRVGGKGNSVP